MSCCWAIVAQFPRRSGAQALYSLPPRRAGDHLEWRGCNRRLALFLLRSDEERSAHFEQLMLAEESGKKNKKGLHSSRGPPVHHVNDVSLPNSANRCASAQMS